MRLMSVLLLNSHIHILNPPTCSHHIQPPETMLDIQVSLLLFIGNGMINDMGQGDFTLTHIHLATHSLGMERHSLECSESLLINTSQALSDIPPFAQRSVLLQSWPLDRPFALIHRVLQSNHMCPYRVFSQKFLFNKNFLQYSQLFRQDKKTSFWRQKLCLQCCSQKPWECTSVLQTTVVRL